jgi:hypothetical protein
MSTRYRKNKKKDFLHLKLLMAIPFIISVCVFPILVDKWSVLTSFFISLAIFIIPVSFVMILFKE